MENMLSVGSQELSAGIIEVITGSVVYEEICDVR